MDLQTQHSMRLRMDDITYYRHLSTPRLIDELNWHFIDTFTDEVMMNVEDLRTFYLNRCGAIVSVLYERQPKEHPTLEEIEHDNFQNLYQ